MVMGWGLVIVMEVGTNSTNNSKNIPIQTGKEVNPHRHTTIQDEKWLLGKTWFNVLINVSEMC